MPVAHDRDVHLHADRVPGGGHVALLALEADALLVDREAVASRRAREVVGVGERPVGRRLELVGAVAGDRAQGVVDAQEAALQRHQRHPDRRRLEGAAEALLGAVPRGHVGRDAGHAEHAAVAAGDREAQRHVDAPVEHLLEDLRAVRVDRVGAVRAEAPQRATGRQVLAGAAADLLAGEPGDALELRVDHREAALAVLRVEDQRSVVV